MSAEDSASFISSFSAQKHLDTETLETALPSEERNVKNETQSTQRPASCFQRRSKQQQSPIVVTFLIPPTIRHLVSREWIVRVSLQSMCRHLIYSRGLWPLPAVQVEAWNLNPTGDASLASCGENASSNGNVQLRQRQQRQLKASGWNRKIALAQTTLLQFLDDLTWMIGDYSKNHTLSYVILSLGPSWSRPKECYLLDLRNMEEQDDAGSSQLITAQYDGNCDSGAHDSKMKSLEHAFARRLLRDAIMVIDEPRPSKMASSFHLCATFGLNRETKGDSTTTTTSLPAFHSSTDEKKIPSNVVIDNENCISDQSYQSNSFGSTTHQLPPQWILRHNATLASMEASCPTPMSTVCLTTKEVLKAPTTITTTEPLPLAMNPNNIENQTSLQDDHLITWISLRSVLKGFSLR